MFSIFIQVWNAVFMKHLLIFSKLTVPLESPVGKVTYITIILWMGTCLLANPHVIYIEFIKMKRCFMTQVSEEPNHLQ